MGKAERVHHNIITTVRTKKRTYNVTISKTGFKISHVVKDGKRKNTTYLQYGWDEVDEMFDREEKKDV